MADMNDLMKTEGEAMVREWEKVKGEVGIMRALEGHWR